MDLLGHSRMRTTRDIYSHVMPVLTREATDRWAPCCLQVRVGKLQPETTQTALRKGERPGHRVELRGLEPLTPTLPGRLIGVGAGSSESVLAGQRHVRFSANRHE
jgi:hypothetical protein